MDTEEITDMKIMKEVEVYLEKDNIQGILEVMTETVVVGLDLVQDLVLIETGSDVINIENMIIFQNTV